jgi:ABC-type phosphate transport system substrate-binding protein
MKKLHALAIPALLLALGSAPGPLNAGDGESLAIVVNMGVMVSKLTASELEAIFTTSKRTWPDGSNVSVFSYAPDNEVRRTFDKAVLRMSADEVARFWIDQRVRGGAPPPRQVPEPSLAIRLVAKLPGSIAYIPQDLVSPNVKVVARVINGRVVEP